MSLKNSKHVKPAGILNWFSCYDFLPKKSVVYKYLHFIITKFTLKVTCTSSIILRTVDFRFSLNEKKALLIFNNGVQHS